MSCAAAHILGATEMLWLHFWGALVIHLYLRSVSNKNLPYCLIPSSSVVFCLDIFSSQLPF